MGYTSDKAKKTTKKVEKFDSFMNIESLNDLQLINQLRELNVEHFFDEENIENTKVFDFFINRLNVEFNRYSTLYDLYNENHPIYNMMNISKTKVDERICINFAKILVDDLNSYLLGGGINISYENEKINDDIQDYINKTGLIEKINDLCIQSSIYGKAYLLFFYDEEISAPNFVVLNPKKFLLVKSCDLNSNNILGIHKIVYRTLGKTGIEIKTKYKIYTKNKVYLYDYDKKTIKQKNTNYFKYLGILELKENNLLKAIFEPCVSAMLAFNKTISEERDDMSYFADSYMKITGVKINDSSIKDFKNTKICNLTDPNADIQFVTKPDTSQSKETFLERLKDHIYDVANVINLSDDSFGDKSGIGTKYRLVRMDGNADQKKRRLINNIIKNIFEIKYKYKLTLNEKFNKDKLKIEIKNNLPNNLVENADVVSKLAPFLPSEELIRISGISNNPRETVKKKKEEEKELEDTELHKIFDKKEVNNSKKDENKYDENGNLKPKTNNL